MELIAKREKVVEVAAPWMWPAPLGALCFYIEEERSPLRVSWLGLLHVLLEDLQTKSGTATIETNNRTLPTSPRTCVARASSMTHGRYGSELVTLRAWRWGREAGFFAPPDACRLTQADEDHYMETTFGGEKELTPRKLTWRHLDHSLPGID